MAGQRPQHPTRSDVPRGHRREKPVRDVGLILAMAGLVAGCSGGGHGRTPQSVSTAPVSPASLSVASSSPPADARTQIIAQYRAFWAHIPQASQAQPAKRRQFLSPFAVDPELSSLIRGMAKQDALGEAIYGQNVPRPKIATLSVAQGLATVSDCQDSSHSGVERRSDHKKLTVGVARNAVIATMHRSADGTWRVSFVSYPKTSC